MHRIELAALCSVEMRWEKLVADLPPALESVGLVHDDAAADGAAEVLDHGEDGCVILLENVALARQIADYRAGLVPLVVPITLIRHYVERLGIEYLAGQVYLEPHPKELMLRNHV